jgi:N-acetylglucosamine malate deacetylase 2
MPRAVLIFAHPDDETIAIGARMGRFAGAHMVHVTDAAPRNGLDFCAHGFRSLREYREARWEELERMLETAGISRISRQRLDIADQEASLRLTGITRRIAEILQKHRPEVVFTHPYEGGHPDHDACAFAVHRAVALLHSRRARAAPTIPLIIEAPFYHADPSGIGVGMETGTFLPASSKTEEIVFPLSPEEQERKHALIDCFQTQRETLSYFQVTEERFRIAPEYEFRLPPHTGAIFYDSRRWGMSSQWFCELAWEAERALEEELRAACC